MLKAICNPYCNTLPSRVSNVLVCILLSDLPLAFLEIGHPTSANNLMTSAQGHADSGGAQSSREFGFSVRQGLETAACADLQVY